MIRKFSEQHTPWLGLAAGLEITMGAAVSAWGYDGGDYSFLRQNISDLGNPDGSNWAFIFNYSLIAGSVLMAAFISGVSIVAHTRPTYAIAAIGVVATIAMAFVGVYPSAPSSHVEHHLAAGIAFLGTLGLGASFTLYMLLHRAPVFPRWLVVPGLLSAASALGFLLALLMRERSLLPRDALEFADNQGCLYLNVVSLLEWCVLFSILTWSGLTAIAMLRGQVRQASAQD